MPIEPGLIVGGRYRIVKHLAQGGMGTVYKAWDLRLKINVALKEMVPLPGQNPEDTSKLREQFGQEATILARLSHPNLVRVGDFFQDNDNLYLVMDFVDGENLAVLIQKEGCIAEFQIVEWTRQLLDALMYCHQQSVVHRDIKPQNIIIRADGRAILVDFGLVKLWNPDDPRTKTIMRGMGTPEYAPPEQYDTQYSHTDPRSDLYSLGACLYHALTGQAPPTATQRIAGIRPFQEPRGLNPGISEKVEKVIIRAMELNVDRRFPDASTMMAALCGVNSQSPFNTSTYSRTHTEIMPNKANVLPMDMPGEFSNRVPMAEAQPDLHPGDVKKGSRLLPVWAIGAGSVILILSLFFGWWVIGQFATKQDSSLTPLTPQEGTLAAGSLPTLTPTLSSDSATVLPGPTSTEIVVEIATPTLSVGETMVRTVDGMTLVYVPAGLFMMGSADSGRREEMPVHQVTLDAFWIDQTEVTQSQYQACVTAGRCVASAFAEDPDYGGPQQPVVGVTWFDAADYCQWAGARLPTEAEWEYAARSPEGYIYPWGNDFRERIANCYGPVCKDEYDVAAPVGSFPRSASWVGALDLAGNVWEWVADWAYTYPSTPVTNPTGPDTGQYRVTRGGDFDADEDYMRSSFREVAEPAEEYYTLGFRCATTERP